MIMNGEKQYVVILITVLANQNLKPRCSCVRADVETVRWGRRMDAMGRRRTCCIADARLQRRLRAVEQAPSDEDLALHIHEMENYCCSVRADAALREELP